MVMGLGFAGATRMWGLVFAPILGSGVLLLLRSSAFDAVLLGSAAVLLAVVLVSQALLGIFIGVGISVAFVSPGVAWLAWLMSQRDQSARSKPA